MRCNKNWKEGRCCLRLKSPHESVFSIWKSSLFSPVANSWACFVLKQKRLPWTFTFQKNYFYCVKRAPETSKHNGTNMCKFLLRRRHHVGLAMVLFMSHDHCYYKLCFSFFVFCIYHSWLIGVLLDLLTSSTDLKFKSICSHLSKAFVVLSKI